VFEQLLLFAELWAGLVCGGMRSETIGAPREMWHTEYFALFLSVCESAERASDKSSAAIFDVSKKEVFSALHDS